VTAQPLYRAASPSHAGSNYLTALASDLASSMGLQPLTAQSDLRTAAANAGVASVLDLMLGRTADRDRTAEVDEYVMLALQCARPKTMGQVPAQQIIRCWKNLAAEPADFRAFVETPLQRLERGLKLHKMDTVGAAWWQVHAARDAARAKSPLSYLLDVRDELTPKTIAGRFQRIVKGTY
jgi:hypothetical protein